MNDTPAKTRRKVVPPVDRFWPKVEKTKECWNWTATKTPDGYGLFYINEIRKMETAHRFSYELVNPPVPVGHEIDHLCRNRACVNPGHLEAVTQHTNMRRGVGQAAMNARKTHCIRGHEFTPENTYVRGIKRACIECRRLEGARRTAAQKATRAKLTEGNDK